MADSSICVFYYPDDITLLYTLFPLVHSRAFGRRFRFTSDVDFVLNRCSASTLLVLRLFKRKKAYQNPDFLQRLRERYRRLIYVDDRASADDLDTVAFPYVDLYFKKQMYRDTGHYRRGMYGKRLYTDYYHRQYGITDAREDTRPPITEADIGKLRLLWNLGIGPYPKTRNRARFARRLQPAAGVHHLRMLRSLPRKQPRIRNRRPVISARFSTDFDRNTVAFHRSLFLEAAAETDACAVGHVPLREYNAELRRAAGVLSPFGWGEIAFRDFEAAAHGAVLLKPDMGHIATWPDVFKPNETYVPTSWSADDLRQRATELLDAGAGSRGIADSAFEAWHSAFLGLDERVGYLISEIEKL